MRTHVTARLRQSSVTPHTLARSNWIQSATRTRTTLAVRRLLDALPASMSQTASPTTAHPLLLNPCYTRCSPHWTTGPGTQPCRVYVLFYATFSCGIWAGLVSSPSMIAFPSRLHGDSVPSVDDQDYPTEDCVRKFGQESYRIMALRKLCGYEIIEFFARTTEPYKDITGTTARTSWTCVAAQHAAVAATRRGWRPPCDGCGAPTLAKLDDPLQAQAPCTDTDGKQVLMISTRASTKPTSGSQLRVTALRYDEVMLYPCIRDTRIDQVMLYPCIRDTRIDPAVVFLRLLNS